jgi:hypothetical protein
MSKCGIWLGGQKGVFVFMSTKMVFLVREIFGWQHLFFLWGAFYEKGCIGGTICLQMHPDPISDEPRRSKQQPKDNNMDENTTNDTADDSNSDNENNSDNCNGDNCYASRNPALDNRV